LALLAANLLLYLAAVVPPVLTGFWDREPQRSPGRLRRVLAQEGFPPEVPLDGRIWEKRSVMAHLPRGVQAQSASKSPSRRVVEGADGPDFFAHW
jgi:hypothetical protein